MSQRSFRLECSLDSSGLFQFVDVDSGEVSTEGEYGVAPAILNLDGDIFYCAIEDPDEPDPKVLKVDSVSVCPTEVLEVEDWEAEGEEAGPVLVTEEDGKED